MSQRVTFYIDGFNFYYGLKRTKRNEPQWADYYWIDLVKLCQSFLGEGQQVEKVIYFTASPLNPEKSSRQSAFLNANKLINGDRFEIVLVSADSDLVPPLEFIQKQYPEKRIKVYFPPSNFSSDLKDNLIHHSSKPVLMYKNERRFRDAIMPNVVEDGVKRYEIPEKWIPANIVKNSNM